MKIVLASSNKKKIAELRAILSGMLEGEDIEVITLKEAGIDTEIEENGNTFDENALIKANVAASTGMIGVADDSGLVVDALDGAPGVYSARYCGYHGDDQKNRDVLLENMKDVVNRSAHFTSAIALVAPDGKELVVEGHTYGKILREETGTGGFGYDCLFESDDLGKSFGLATAEEKNAVSHRFRALQQLLKVWKA